jgi:hypothetical protein
VGWNLSTGGREIDLFNTDTTGNGFLFAQRLTATTSKTLMTLGKDGGIQLPHSKNTGNPADLAGVLVENTGATASSHAIAVLRSQGNGGSPYLSMDVTGVAGWSIGVDNADSEKLKIRRAWDFTGTPAISIDGNNTVSCAARLFQSNLQVPIMVFGSAVVGSQNLATFGVNITISFPVAQSSLESLVITVCSGDRIANADFFPLSATIDGSNLSSLWVLCRGSNTNPARINYCMQYLY